MTETAAVRMIRVSALEELRSNGVVVVRGRNIPIAVFYHEGEVHAVDNRCPHMGFPFHKGSVQDGILTCHWHQARFDLCSGCTFDLWADDVLPFDCKVEDGIVYVSPVPREKTDADYHRKRLVRGMEQDISLIQAKSILGLLDSGTDMRALIREVAFYGSRQHDRWGSGMTLLAVVANLLPHLDNDTAYFAMARAVSELAGECSDTPPRRERERLGGGHDVATLKRWMRHWTRTRHRDGAERTFLTAAEQAESSEQLADILFTAACDRPFADIGHIFDFCNKACELAGHFDEDSLKSFASLLMRSLVAARGGEESAHWHHPVDIITPLHEAHGRIQAAMHEGEGKEWNDDGSLVEVLLGDDVGEILNVLLSALSSGAPPHELSKRVAYAAAMRLARFATTNDISDWFGPQHTFTYANAVHQALKRCSTPDVVRSLFHAAIAVFNDRFLNIPPAKLPGERGDLEDLPKDAEALLQAFLDQLDQRAEIEGAARLAARYLRLGHSPSRLFNTLTYATVREDLDFHPFQVLEAGIQQFAEWEGCPEAEHIIVGVVRNLAAVCPTRRAALQTATIALRLHRREKVYEEED